MFLILYLLVSCATVPVKDKEVDHFKDAQLYYKFKDYRQAILSARKVLEDDYSQEQKEEALYIINESAEEIVTELKRELYIKEDSWFLDQIYKLKEKFEIKIIFEKIGYESFLYYDKSAYLKLKELNPESSFVKKIEDKHLAREARFITDPNYRYNEVLRVIEQYQKIYNKAPDALYAASILLRIADLYLYLYDNSDSVKKELKLSDSQIKGFYKKAYELYRKIKKEHPQSEEAQNLGYIIDNVRLRKTPSTKGKVIQRIPAGTMVRIVDRSEKRESISNMYDYWYKVKLVNGTEGWIYGFYLRTTFIQ